MAYVVGKDPNHPKPALARLDHLICRVPDIERFHAHFRDVLGFSEAWPIGRFWPEGRTSGIALGGVNLEFIQPDVGAPDAAVCDTLVFEPTTLEKAEQAFTSIGVRTRRFDKIEPDPGLLKLRGFEEDELHSPQLICRNLLLESQFPVPMFLCEYVPKIKARLSASNPELTRPYGRVLSMTVELAKPGAIWKLTALGYLGDIELLQTEDSFGEPRITEIRFETGPVELQGIDPGFRFI